MIQADQGRMGPQSPAAVRPRGRASATHQKSAFPICSPDTGQHVHAQSRALLAGKASRPCKMSGCDGRQGKQAGGPRTRAAKRKRAGVASACRGRGLTLTQTSIKSSAMPETRPCWLRKDAPRPLAPTHAVGTATCAGTAFGGGAGACSQYKLPRVTQERGCLSLLQPTPMCY
jgi:hypothetical protein